MLSKAALDVLDALHTGGTATPAELADMTGYSQTHLYEVLDTLVGAGVLTETRRNKNQRYIRAADHLIVDTYRRLVSQLGHVDWTELLSPARLRVCWYLDEPRRVAEIADRLHITRQAVHNALSPFKGRAMLSPAGPEYALSDDLAPLLAFARAVVSHAHRQRLREVAPSATIVWCDPKRALVRPQTAADTDRLQSDPDWQVTGLARMQDFELQFYLAAEPAFWYGPETTLTPAEIVCHTLVLDSDTRRISYALLLIAQLGIEYETLTATAGWYDLEPTVEGLYQGLDGEITSAADAAVSLPSDAEFMRLKEQYGVS